MNTGYSFNVDDVCQGMALSFLYSQTKSYILMNNNYL